MAGLAAVVLGLALVAPAAPPALAQSPWLPGGAPHATSADSRREPAPAQAPLRPGRPPGVAAELADWVAGVGDNGERPFMVVDKLAAEVFAYDAHGRLLSAAPVLVGLTPGDDAYPGVGDLELSEIGPDLRTTPAGRFDAFFGPSDGHGQVLWVDYADGISMHPVITTNPSEHRLERIRSAFPPDHRISFGCINVPAKFYRDVVLKAFAAGGVVYVLPDTKPVQEVFPAFAARIAADAASQPALPQDRCWDRLRDVLEGGPDPSASLPCGPGERGSKDALAPP